MSVKRRRSRSYQAGSAFIRSLHRSMKVVPEEPGIYLVLRSLRKAPRILKNNPAGHFKGRDPTLPVPELRKRLKVASQILYVGKASGSLRDRIGAYLSHGAGNRVAHWGGRAIWQLANSDAFLVVWFPASSAGARRLERELLREFKAIYGCYPFANRTG